MPRVTEAVTSQSAPGHSKQNLLCGCLWPLELVPGFGDECAKCESSCYCLLLLTASVERLWGVCCRSSSPVSAIASCTGVSRVIPR